MANIADLENEDKPLSRSDGLALLVRVFKENAPRYWPRYAAALVLMGLVAAATGASAWIMKSVINDVFIARDQAMIQMVALGVFVIFFVRGFADYGQVVIMNSIGRRIIGDHQKRLYIHLLDQGMEFFNSASLGQVVARVTHSAAGIRQVLDLVIRSLGKDALSLIALGTVMVMQDPILSLFALVVAPIVIISLRVLARRIRSIGQAEFSGMALIISGLKDSVLGIRVVKAFGLEERLIRDMGVAIDNTARRSMKISNLAARSSPLMETIVGIVLAGVIFYAGSGVANSERDAGSLFAFLMALLLAYEPAKRLARLHLSLETALIGVRILYAFIDRPIKLLDKPDASPLVITRGEVELRNVTFSYGKGAALTDMSVTFPAGRLSALVGGSGAGKSTIFSLIERFYDPQKGAVLIDGQDLRDVTSASLRAHIAYVTQEAFLFEGTIGENILAGRPDAEPDDVIAAAKAANAHDFIMEFPDGYDRVVGEGGANLSGGQRQRIAIARAMLRDAPILLLDEATSALDAQSEATVKEALDALMKDRTTIVIAHRLSTVRNADIIHVIEEGRLVESGTHDELVTAGGVYANLSALQLAGDFPSSSALRAGEHFPPAAE